MSIRRYIFIPMTVVIVTCMITAFVLSWRHFTASMYDVAQNKVNVAAISAMHSIETFEQPARLASIITAENPNLVDAVLSNDHTRVLSAAYNTMIFAQTDFCTILDSNGIVIARTHEPDQYGDSLAYQYGITQALSGGHLTTIEPGSVILLSVRSAAPIYDNDMNIIGVVSLGYRFDNPEFVTSLKETTGCEIIIYSGNECINSTITDEVSAYLIRESADIKDIVSNTLAGEEFHGELDLEGRDLLARFLPITGPEGIVVGSLGIVDFWRENNEQLEAFQLTVIIIISVSLLIIFAVSYIVTQLIDRRLNSLVDALNETGKNRDAIMEALHSRIVIIALDTDEILYMNEQMKKAQGLTEDITGLICWELFSPQSKGRCAHCPKNNPDFMAGKPYTWELSGPDMEWTSRITSRILDWPDGRKVMIEHIEDITELKKTEKLKYELYAAESASKAKSAFLTSMSHEIRTPMNAILGIAENQLRNRNLSPELEEDLEIIYESGYLLLNIINDILDLSKIEAGKMEIVPVKYDMPSLINDTVQLVHLRYDSRPIEFVLDVDADTPLNLSGDDLRIKQVLNNVLSNAFKYTDEGEIRLYVSAEPLSNNNQSEFEDEICLIFEVSDTGRGMTQEQLRNLFDEYKRFNLDTNRTTIGTGLGMSITKQLVELMGGEVSVNSEFGKGTIFTARIPQKRLDNLVCGKDMADKLSSFKFRSSVMGKKRNMDREYMPYGSVLIVDDVTSNTHVARGMLLPYGLDIDTADSGFSAIAKIVEGKEYDIIFMDHMMPHMDGIETVKILREQHGYKKTIIALTANALVGHAEMFLENGFDAFISKPIDSRELDAALYRFILDKQPPEIVEAARRERAEVFSKTPPAQPQDEKPQNAASQNAVSSDLDRELSLIAMDDIEQVITNIKAMNIGAGELSDEQLNTYRIAVHGIKNVLFNVGEHSLADYAKRLETAALEKDTDIIIRETVQFTDELEAVLNKLKQQLC